MSRRLDLPWTGKCQFERKLCIQVCMYVCVHARARVFDVHCMYSYKPFHHEAQSAGAEEYTDCFFPGYDIKQSGGEASVMQKLGGIGSTSSLPSLPGGCTR